jgi:hypothetical protein
MRKSQEEALLQGYKELTASGDKFTALYIAKTCGYFIAQMALNGVPAHFEKHREHEDHIFALLDAQVMFIKVAIAEAQEGK